jgi:benzoate-CoA ligase family protein
MGDHFVSVDRSVTPSALTFSENFNVAPSFIDRHLSEGRGDKTAIRAKAGSVTYAELATGVNQCGNALRAMGLAPGDRVLMVVKDCAEFFYIFWGAIKAGFVPAPLNTLLRAGDYKFMIETSQCAALIYSPEFSNEVGSALVMSDHKPAHVHITENADGQGVAGQGAETLTDVISVAPVTLEPAPATADSDCFWLFSSGSTGMPKAAVHAHRDMVATSEYYGVGVLGLDEDAVCFSAAKLFFAYGLGNAMTFPLWVGGQAILFPGRPTPDDMFSMIEAYKPTCYFGVPTLYAAQLQSFDIGAAPDLSSLQYCVSAGEPLPGDILRRWKERTGLDILDGIGTTEILHIFISNHTGVVKAGTSGQIVPGYEARIVDEHGDDVATGDIGALRIKGGSTLKYYWRNPEKSAGTIQDGWVHTGDTYYQDEDGYFVCCGRSDDMMKVGGIWCSPVEIEARLIEHPQVLEAAIVGRPDDDELIKPEAYIILVDGAAGDDALKSALIDHCKAGLAPYKYPRWFNFVAELPKTATGKIQRFKLRAAVA